MHGGNEVVPAVDARVMVDHAVLEERRVAHARAGLTRRDTHQALTWPHDVGEVLGVDLGAGVVAGGPIRFVSPTSLGRRMLSMPVNPSFVQISIEANDR